MIIYSDFQCPYCGSFSRDTLPFLETDYVQTGKLMLAFRNLPLQNLHPLAVRAAETGVCANNQGRFWQWHDALFAPGNLLQQEGFASIRAAAGLNPTELDACLSDKNVSGQVSQEIRTAAALGIRSTPTFIIGTRQIDDTVKAVAVISGAVPLKNFRSALDGVVVGRLESR